MAAVTVRLFAQAREAAGHPRLRREVPSDGIELDELLRQLGTSYPALARLLPTCRISRNGAYIAPGRDRVRAGDELAIHPPYSGG